MNQYEEKILISQLGKSGWYPDDPGRLTDMLTNKLKGIENNKEGKTKALILPHAGYAYCGDVFAKGIHTIQNKDGQKKSNQSKPYTKAIIIGPSHYRALNDLAILTNYTGIQTPLGIQPIDQEAVAAIQKKPHFKTNDPVHDPEHSIQMHIPFLQIIYPDLPIVPIIIGNLSRQTCQSIAQSLQCMIDNQTLIMISSDFTHYGERFGYIPFPYINAEMTKEGIKKIDRGAIEPITKNNREAYGDYIQKTETTICGRFAIQVLLDLCQKTTTKITLCEYQMSGEITGDYKNSVSYASCCIQGEWV